MPLKNRFVIHEHYASHHHFDFRLEMDGALKSWAIPKHPPAEPGEKRLAILVEDHPLDYIDFEGDIPQGEYGAGRVLIWDKGSYVLTEKDENKIVFSLEGTKLKGNFTLLRLKKGQKGNEWLLLRQK
jgi:bifunctional non-homologous end joining protein LigD